MGNYLLVRHEVRDYSAWKPEYDADLPNRVQAGLTERFLFRGADDPNEIIILFEADDIARAKEFTQSAGMRETMERAGVVGKPDVYFLHGESQAMGLAA